MLDEITGLTFIEPSEESRYNTEVYGGFYRNNFGYWYENFYKDSPFIVETRVSNQVLYVIFPYIESDYNERLEDPNWFEPIPFDNFEDALFYYRMKYC